MSTEIERKFRLAEAPDWLSDCDSEHIDQGYLAIEEEVDIDERQFEALWPLTEGRRVAKMRYLVPHDSLEIEVDVFESELKGMVIAEIEFGSETASEDFDPPDWFGEEVTGDPRYANETLAVDGPPEEGDE